MKLLNVISFINISFVINERSIYMVAYGNINSRDNPTWISVAVFLKFW